MYFKSLELVGFKSFAEKTKLNFEPGVTAVVGPNGCGKSNVADAIRWVLGEQSAKSLRASTMQDVIFNGTDTKEPINFAEVSLSFSNEKRMLPIDYDEVTITRRVFRSGDSEYLLNKTPVRLKDIADLLMGTGIGTESYSIIEQGKMDLILSSKPEDRRYVFEEASGITKYKSKKKEAMRKLEQTEQNLLRINDIITEVKRQISSIERQAKKAEKYKVDFEKLKEMEVKFSFSEYKNLKTREATHAVENEDTKSRERDLDAEIKSASSKISEFRQSLSEVNNKISELKNKYSEMSNLMDMNKHKIEIDLERIEEGRVLQEGLQKEMESARDKIRNAKALVDKLKADLEKVASDRSNKQRSVEEKELALDTLSKDIEETEAKTKTFRVQIVDYLSKETHIKNDLIKLGADVQNRKARQRRLELEKDEVRKELESVEKFASEALAEFAAIEGNVSALRSDFDLKKSAISVMAADIKNLEADIAREENRKAATRSRIEMLEESLRRHEGFKAGVKNLLAKVSDGDSSFGGILGVLADLIKVERGYEDAVDTFLGDDAQVVIVASDSDLSRAVDYLKNNRMGKASFVSLETLGRISRASGAQPAGLSPLRNFVKIDQRFASVVEHFFANAYLVDLLEDGIKNIGASGDVTFVTKSGHMFSNYKISGGSSSGNEESLLIGRRDRLEGFRVELKDSEDKASSLNASRAEKTESARTLEAEIASLEGTLRQEEIKFANAKMKKDAQEENIRKLKDEVFLVDSELGEVSATIDEQTKKGESLNLELNSIENEKTSMQVFIDQSQGLVSEKRAERERTTIDITRLKAETQSIEKDEENVRNNLGSQEAILFEAEETLYNKESLSKESADKVRSFEGEITVLSLQNDQLAGDLKALGDESATIEGSRADLSARLNMDEVKLKEKEAQIESLRNQVRDLDVRLTEINFKKTNLKDRILQSYKIDLEVTHIEVEENIDWDSLKAQVIELKERLEKMGPVNLVAIDEHKELEERHSFLVHQQEDLVNAKDSLLKAIQKINKTTKELFMETFQKIQVEFKNFFRQLFGGGQAELVLIDEQDILESGIEIIVRPPGKKLQNLMLLSGGEKALTACALLFSIFKVKPSPFCVLDELDAPLDESNVMRFANMLKEFVKTSQFIIITHNKRTMELADVIYGITMQERGISKIVSVKFLDERKQTSAKIEKAVEAESAAKEEIAVAAPVQAV